MPTIFMDFADHERGSSEPLSRGGPAVRIKDGGENGMAGHESGSEGEGANAQHTSTQAATSLMESEAHAEAPSPLSPLTPNGPHIPHLPKFGARSEGSAENPGYIKASLHSLAHLHQHQHHKPHQHHHQHHQEHQPRPYPSATQSANQNDSSCQCRSHHPGSNHSQSSQHKHPIVGIPTPHQKPQERTIAQSLPQAQLQVARTVPNRAAGRLGAMGVSMALVPEAQLAKQAQGGISVPVPINAGQQYPDERPRFNDPGSSDTVLLVALPPGSPSVHSQHTQSSGHHQSREHDSHQLLHPLKGAETRVDSSNLCLTGGDPSGSYRDPMPGAGHTSSAPAGGSPGVLRVLVHKHVLQQQSRYFEAQFSDRWSSGGSAQERETGTGSGPFGPYKMNTSRSSNPGAGRGDGKAGPAGLRRSCSTPVLQGPTCDLTSRRDATRSSTYSATSAEPSSNSGLEHLGPHSGSPDMACAAGCCNGECCRDDEGEEPARGSPELMPSCSHCLCHAHSCSHCHDKAVQHEAEDSDEDEGISSPKIRPGMHRGPGRGPGEGSRRTRGKGRRDARKEGEGRGGSLVDEAGRQVVTLQASECVADPTAYLTALRLMYLCEPSPHGKQGQQVAPGHIPSQQNNHHHSQHRTTDSFGGVSAVGVSPSSVSPGMGTHGSASGSSSEQSAASAVAASRVQRELILLSSLLAVLEVVAVAAQLLALTLLRHCLDYLESVPWSEDEEDAIQMVLADLQLSQAANSEGQAVLGRLPAPLLSPSEVKRKARELLDRCLRWQPPPGASDLPASTSVVHQGHTAGGGLYGAGAGAGAVGGPTGLAALHSHALSWVPSSSSFAFTTPGALTSSLPVGAVPSHPEKAQGVRDTEAGDRGGDKGELRAAVLWMLRRPWPSGLFPWEAKREVVAEAFLGLRQRLEAEYDKYAKGGNNTGVFQSRRDARKLARETSMVWLVVVMLELLMGDELFRWLAEDGKLVREVKYCCLNAEEPHKLARTAMHGALKAFKQNQVIVPAGVRCAFAKLWFPILSEENAFGEGRFFNVRCRTAEREDVVDGFNRLVMTLPAPEQEALLRQWRMRSWRAGDTPHSAHSSIPSSSSGIPGLAGAGRELGSSGAAGGVAGSGAAFGSGSGSSRGWHSHHSQHHSHQHQGHVRGSHGGGGAMGPPSSPFTLREAYLRWLKRFGEPSLTDWNKG